MTGTPDKCLYLRRPTLGVGRLRAEVKAECRPDQTGESWQKLVGQIPSEFHLDVEIPVLNSFESTFNAELGRLKLR